MFGDVRGGGPVRCRDPGPVHIVDDMNILVDLPESLLRDLNRVAPPRSRKRAEFIRTAIRKALMEEEERHTRAAYEAQPDTNDVYFDPRAWAKATSPAQPRASSAKRKRRK